MMAKQLATWDSVYHPNVKTIYYHGSGPDPAVPLSVSQPHPWSQILEWDASDDYDQMHWKHKLTLDYISQMPYDLVFRINSSSYVHKARLAEFAVRLPWSKCYCGKNGGEFASGCGLWLTPDMVDLFRMEMKPGPRPPEDVYMGQIAASFGIPITPGAKRCDFYFQYTDAPDEYHWRVKSNTTDRTKDLKAMDWLFNKHYVDVSPYKTRK